MIEKVRKRDGRVVKFDKSRIMRAILKAGQATGEFDKDIAEELTNKALSLIEHNLKNIPSVEEIQDIVERVLLNSSYKKTAKLYILYRDQHAKIREITTKASLDLVDQYLAKVDWRVNENSNMSFSLQGLNNYIDSEIIKTYWLNSIYPPEVREPYINGDIHIHDLSSLSVYCVGWDLHDILTVGFSGVSDKIESNPPKHFRVVLDQIINFFYTLQGEAAGAQAVSNFDTLLAPFIRSDKLGYNDIKQALQEFLFNLNIPTRVGFQTPFTNLSFDLKVPEILKNQPVIIGGKLQNSTYGEFQKEVDMINKAFLEVMLEGDAKGRVFSFPIPTYNITDDFDWEDPKFQLLWQVTGKYGTPYFGNFVESDMNPSDVRSMCCRLRLDTRKLKTRGGGLFASYPLTGSIGVVTLNLPRIGYLSKTKEEYKDRLSHLLDIAVKSLEIKRKILEQFTEAGLYPYIKFYLRNIRERFKKYWVNHFSTIGIIGMNESCLNFMGENISTEKGKSFAIEIMNFIRDRLLYYQKETGNLYNLEATPAEGTSYRLALLDKKKYSDIICANEDAYKTGSDPYYTNSTCLPVDYTNDLFGALKHQDELQTLYTGGTVFHIFMGEHITNYESIGNLIKKVFTKFKLPYITITPTFSICPNHGYLSGQQDICPKCNSSCEIYSRVVGYFRPVKQWNKGKKTEFKDRKYYEISNI